MVVDQTPKYMRWTKVPIVKAKIGPKIVTLIADARVFECLPVKTEAKGCFKRYLHYPDQRVYAEVLFQLLQRKGIFARFRKDA